MDFFASSLWDDVVDLLDEKLVEYQMLLDDIDSNYERLRWAQGAKSLGEWVLSLPEWVEDNYSEIEREEKSNG
jgi:hypothetical protein